MNRFDQTYDGDMYREMAHTRAAAQASVAFQALQTGLLSQMSDSMNAVHAEMANVRRQQGVALAIQQELLNREQIQSYLEEFIFQAEKLVAECSKTTTDIPPSSRYFTMMSVLGKIQEDGIGTPIIKGRDNKAAFEKVVTETKGLTQKLLKDPEVQEAIEWAEAEQTRREQQLEADHKRLETERVRAERERQENIKKLEQKLGSLQRQLKTISFGEQVRFEWDRTGAFLDKWFLSKCPKSFKTPLKVIAVLLSPIFILALPIFVFAIFADAEKRKGELNRDTNEKIAAVMQQLSKL